MIRTYTVNSTLKLENKESAVITIILKGENISIDYALENGDYNILVFNDSESDVNLEESGYIKNGSLKISYIELNNFKYRQHNTLEVYKDSSLTVDSIYLVINNKEIVDCSILVLAIGHSATDTLKMLNKRNIKLE